MPHTRSGPETWCRARSLEQTASILKDSASAFGVSRVGSITRLDGIGLPTVTAIRSDPIGESVSVSTGKGPTELHAQVGALAEALERYCAEPRGRLHICSCRADELNEPILLPARLILPEDVDGSGVVDWCAGRALDGSPVWVPANAVLFPYIPTGRAERLFAAHTTGLAAGASTEEALVFALLECIERDAYSRGVALATAGHGERIPVVDLESARAIALDELEAIQSRGHDILIRDLTCDSEVPCYLCTIHDGVLTHLGVAARPDAINALRAAIQEAAQSRLTDIQGAREDLTDRDSSAPVHSWFLTGGSAEIVPIRSGWSAASPQEVVAGLDARLRALEPSVQSAWVDLSLEGVNLAVVRAITPGLEIWAFDPFRVGPRAREWLCPSE